MTVRELLKLILDEGRFAFGLSEFRVAGRRFAVSKAPFCHWEVGPVQKGNRIFPGTWPRPKRSK